MRYLITLILCLATIGIAPSFARDLPSDGIYADLTAIEYPFVRLAGKPMRLAPGARIFDVVNRIIMPNTVLVPAKALYRLDTRGDVREIWLLTADETAILKNSNKKRQQ